MARVFSRGIALIEQTTESIESELAQLDPVARAQVLREVGERQFQRLIPGGE